MALIERLALRARCPAKSSVQSWLAGSKPWSSQYLAHWVSWGQYLAAKSAFFSICGDGGDHDQHVAALLDGHLVLLGSLAAAVDLSGRGGIRTQVVRGEGKFPPRRGRVIENGHNRCLGQGGVEEEQMRELRDRSRRPCRCSRCWCSPWGTTRACRWRRPRACRRPAIGDGPARPAGRTSCRRLFAEPPPIAGRRTRSSCQTWKGRDGA